MRISELTNLEKIKTPGLYKRLTLGNGAGFNMNANIIRQKCSLSRIFLRSLPLTSKYFHFAAFLNKTLRFGMYDGLKQSNTKIDVKSNKRKSSFIEFHGGEV